MEERTLVTEEKIPRAISGMAVLILGILLLAASVALFVTGAVGVSRADAFGMPAPNGAVAMMIIGAVYWLFAWAPFAGLKIIKPNEALVLTLFGNYYGSLKSPGFFYVNPFCVGVNPAVREPGTPQDTAPAAAANTAGALDLLHKKDSASGKKISLKAITHNNGKQKINDQTGQPHRDRHSGHLARGQCRRGRVQRGRLYFRDYLSIQADSRPAQHRAALPLRRLGRRRRRQRRPDSPCAAAARRWPCKLKAGAPVQGGHGRRPGDSWRPASPTLPTAPEIAAAMLQRQQASAPSSTRSKLIVDGAVGMVEMALQKAEPGRRRRGAGRASARPPWSPTCWWCCAATATPSRW
jgi:hypothetical protein